LDKVQGTRLSDVEPRWLGVPMELDFKVRLKSVGVEYCILFSFEFYSVNSGDGAQSGGSKRTSIVSYVASYGFQSSHF
jgi:hypothetical protein